MTYRNECVPPRPIDEALYHSTTRLQDYDLNWVYRSVPPSLETLGGVRLVPLIPSIHGRRLYKLFSNHRETYHYLPYGPFESYSQFLTKLELARRDENTLSFAVYDLSIEFDEREQFEVQGGKGLREERLAGIVGVKESQPKNRMTEIGNVHIAPPFQKSHVSTHAISLLLHWLLDPPSPSTPHNLGLRRVQWFANPLNVSSVIAATKLGFQLEAKEMKWERTLPLNRGKICLDLPKFLLLHDDNHDDNRYKLEVERGGGRHSSLLSLDWERWETLGARDFVDRVVERKIPVKRKFKDLKGLALGED